MTDSHCHLDHCDDPAAAADPALRLIVSVGTTLERCERTLALAERFANVRAAVGIHPNEAGQAQDASVRRDLEVLARHERVVAIGETGVDRYWERVAPEVQAESFRWQADLARRLGKPLILHVRDRDGSEAASSLARDLILEADHRQGILHCFNGHAGLLEAGLGLGWFVSFAGNLSYKNAHALHAAARTLPQERLLLETDSPFLSPQPERGKPNRPAFVRHTAAALAALRSESLETVEAYTDANAARVYGLSG